MPDTRFSFTPERFKEIVRDVLVKARARGATATETEVSESVGQSVTVRQGEVETIEYTRDKGLALTVYIGQQLRGALGALVALAALLTGPFFFVIGVGMIYDRLRDYDAVIAALAGVTAAAMGMLMLVVVKGSLRASRTDGGLLIITSVAMAIGVLRWPMIPVLLVAAPVSIGLAWRRGLRNV